MNCEQVKDLLSAYLDDQLTADERQSVSDHLPFCPQCAGILADYRRFDALLAQLPRVAPTPDLRNRILATTGPSSNDGRKKPADAHHNSLQMTLLSLPVKNFFPKLQALSKSSSSSLPAQQLLNQYPRRSFFSLQLTLILVIVLLTIGIRLLFIHYCWQKRS